MATLQELQQAVSEIQNSVTRSAAQALLTLAQASGDPNVINIVGDMLSLSAKGSGVAVFYSGIGPNNRENRYNAQDVIVEVLGGNGYTFSQTPLGAYVEAYATKPVGWVERERNPTLLSTARTCWVRPLPRPQPNLQSTLIRPNPAVAEDGFERKDAALASAPK